MLDVERGILAHAARLLGLSRTGGSAGRFGFDTVVVPTLRLPFPSVLIVVWAVTAAGAAVQVLGWPALFRVLLAYGLASRLVVTLVMLFAMLGDWGTHYDYVGMRGRGSG
jgi:hypothetical protein